jgi:hypothetical protein
MRNLRNLLLLVSGMAFAACAVQTFRSEKAPEYVTTGDPTLFYLKSPRRAAEPDGSLKPETRVKLLRKSTGYSLVLLEDSRKGYVANAYIIPAPPESQKRPFGSSAESDSQTRRKRRAIPRPTPAATQATETPSGALSSPPADATPSPDLQAPPVEVPSPTPVPEAPLEKPKFRL